MERRAGVLSVKTQMSPHSEGLAIVCEPVAGAGDNFGVVETGINSCSDGLDDSAEIQTGTEPSKN